MQTTVLQGVGNALLDLGWEIFNLCNSEPGIFKLTDVETEFCNHRLEASNLQLHVHISDIHLIVTMTTDKKVIN